MSYEAAVRHRLLDVAAFMYKDMQRAAAQVADRYKRLLGQLDVDGAMGSFVDFEVAIEDVPIVFKECATRGRPALRTALADTEAPQARGQHHFAFNREKPRKLLILNERMVPAEYWVQPVPVLPPRRIDVRRLKRDLEGGLKLPKVAEVRDDPEPELVIKSYKSVLDAHRSGAEEEAA
jgi:hypothetical protein